MIAALAVVLGLAGALSVALLVAARLCERDDESLADAIEARLPQIQCGQCGYPGCRPYAEAVAQRRAAINLCPPGGDDTIASLAGLLGEDPMPIDHSLGAATMSNVARIDEAICIGCNLCARACPVDAIVGVQHMMHTVITAHCTGCELCLPPCPVDCIDLVARA